jgi:TolB-like protein/Tfp pilus assembly protein PilF
LSEGDPQGSARPLPGKIIFLSYASEDVAIAALIGDALRAAGIEVWLDQSELRGGDTWDASIRSQINACFLFVPIISKNSQMRTEGYFRLEWRLAVDRSRLMAAERHFLLPVVVDDTTDREALVPAQFREVQWTRLVAGKPTSAFVEHVGRLVAADGRLIDRPARPYANATQQRPSGFRQVKLAAWIGAATLALGAMYLVYERRLGPLTSHVAAPPVVVSAVASAQSPKISAPEKSIAVLAFVDMSEKKDQEYFSDGLTEELIDRLAQNDDLKVIARTSSFQFKGKNEDLRAIATQLGVSNLLEGSVRKSGKRLRITIQLIRGSDGAHVWSQAYDRELKDVFAVQREIASAVAQTLKVSLVKGSEASESTKSVEAYGLYLKAIAVRRPAVTAQEVAVAVDYARQAIKIDPSFALAWAELAEDLSVQADQSPGRVEMAGLNEEGGRAAEHALKLAPNLAITHTTMARSVIMADWDIPRGEMFIKQALALDPNNSYALAWAAGIASWKDHQPEAVQLIERAISLDPANAQRYSDQSVIMFQARRYADALEANRRQLELQPIAPANHLWVGEVLLAMGDPAAALEESNHETDAQLSNGCGCRALFFDALGRRAEADAVLETLKRDRAGERAYDIAVIYASRGQLDEAFGWFERAYQQHDNTLLGVRVDPMLKNVQTDPRFRKLLLKMKLTDLPTSGPTPSSS